MFWEIATLAVSEVTPDINARLASFGAALFIFCSNVVEAYYQINTPHTNQRIVTLVIFPVAGFD
jgi:hypothetical protein